MEGSGQAKTVLGLGHWMKLVLQECDRAHIALDVDAVHDLRVALRRCRSIADGLMMIDPSPSWRQMKRAGRRLFRGLGALRDAQVMSEWVRRLAPEDDSERKLLLGLLAEEESQHKVLAGGALRNFDTKRWRKWSRELPARSAQLEVGTLVFKQLALERWTEARDLHRQAVRNRSQVAFHRLRIGIKRFRYIVENFLPQQHEMWSSDLKELQDVLGEVHDLDVLRASVRSVNAFSGPDSRTRWQGTVQSMRNERIARYRERMLGSHSLWSTWRADLPQGEQIQAAAMTRLKVWASFLDPDVKHSQHVAELARQVFDGLQGLGLMSVNEQPEPRAILLTAAFLHDVGLAQRCKGHHKASFRMITKLAPPLGWSSEDLLLVATVVRFHRGGLPFLEREPLRELAAGKRQLAKLLAGILRFADAFDNLHDGHVRTLRVENKNGILLVSAAGYRAMSQTGQHVAAARHLLEVVLQKPVLVRPLRGRVRHLPAPKSARVKSTTGQPTIDEAS
jgi:CHAD domain-containing protein